MTAYPPLVYPHGVKWQGPRPLRSDLHPTSGLAGNWALDFMASGGTTVLAIEKAVVWKLSGHDPTDGEVSPSIFGWNVYLHTDSGLIYFYTHLGNRKVDLGQKVKVGQIIGIVGRWPNDPGRSHTHLGVTHPKGITAAKNKIVEVSKSPRVRGRP